MAQSTRKPLNISRRKTTKKKTRKPNARTIKKRVDNRKRNADEAEGVVQQETQPMPPLHTITLTSME